VRSIKRLPLMLTFAATAAIAASDVSAQAGSPLHGALAAGPHPVGFTKLRLADATRPAGPKRDAGGKATIADRSRQLDVHIWYPSAQGTAPPMTFAEYVTAHLPPDDHAAITARATAVRGFLNRFGTTGDEAWATLKATPLLARRDAPDAAGRFPLLIGMLRPVSTTITSEYLASHGYVVAMVHPMTSSNFDDAGPALDEGVRDMEVAIAALRQRPNVDPSALGALGFSGAGFSQILLAMRHPDVDAVCDLESAIFDDRVMFPLKGGWGYRVDALRVPFLHTYSVPLSRRENAIGEFEAMRYSTRYRYLVDAPGIDHWDFATEGMAASSIPGLRGANAATLRAAFETTNRYVLAFFDAYVKHDNAALAFLRRDPEANGAPPGLATIRELPGIEPAPTPEQFTALVTGQGVDAALERLRAARVRDPQARLFQQSVLNNLGYRLLRNGRHDAAIAVLRTTSELYPASSNAYDSLAEALETAGRRADAVQVSRQGLEVLARQDVTAEQRADMAKLLEERIQRLQ
jgi:tetratricopeptide (TPR) repeat protein